MFLFRFLCRVLTHLCSFGSIIRTLREIELDVPFAAAFVASFLGAAWRDKILTEEELKSLVATVPSEKAAVLLSQVAPTSN